MTRRRPSSNTRWTLPALAACVLGACAEPEIETDTPIPRDDGGTDDFVVLDDAGGADADVDDDGEVDVDLPDGCTPACALGDRECVDPSSGDNRYRACISVEGCPRWGPETACDIGTLCQEGECVETCTNVCTPEGSLRCASDTEVQTCEMGVHGCLLWGTPASCPAGEACSGAGECAPCTDSCPEVGSRRCLSGREIQTCEIGPAGCRTWSPRTECPGDDVCWDGACVDACTNLCTPGQRRCLGDQWQNCMRFPTPTACYGWSPPYDCRSGRPCVGEGICPTSCSDACTEGDVRCDGETAYRTCVRNTSGCTGWGALTSCGVRERCEATTATCEPICADSCTTVGARECGVGGEPRECVENPLGCLEWRSDPPCGRVANGSNVCVGGDCVLTCDTGYVMCGPASCRLSCVPWTQQSPIPAFEDLLGLDFVGALVWAVGNSGVVARSDDGGATWRNVAFAPRGTALHGVDFVDAGRGWAVGNAGTILRTVDGAATWEEQTSGVAVNLYGVSFADAMTGWAVGAGGAVLATTDGGTRWTPQSSGVTSDLFSVHFVSNTVGWAAGDLGRILKTVDGGRVWAAQVSGTTSAIRSIRFVDVDVGWAAGYRYIYRTTNGGTSWTAFARSLIQYYGVWGRSRDEAMAVGQSGRIEATVDGGLGWSTRTSGTTRDLRAVVYLDPLRSIAVGQAGTTLSSSNGGVSWIDRRSGTVNDLRAVRFVGIDRGWACGVGGTILATADGGLSWTSQASGTTRNLNALSFPDATHGWAVGDAGTIVATDDGGATWTPQTSFTTSNLEGVHFVDASTGWAVGTYVGGTSIFYTPNGGVLWQPMTVAGVPTTTVYGVWFNPCTGPTCNGWVVGTSGTIRYTTNFGASWRAPSSTGTSQTLYGVRFVDDLRGFAVGAGGTVVVTTDGGVTWTPRGTSVTTTLYDVAFVDADHGFVAGAGGTFLKTVDAGATWNSRPVPTTRNLRGIAFVDTETGWVAGDSGTILKTRSAGE